MKNRIRRRSGAAVHAILMGMLVLCAAKAAPAHAQTASACRAALTGAYLATIRLPEAKGGGVTSRALITLHADGAVAVVDSNQRQGANDPRFSAQQGAYRCIARNRARARTLDFTFPDRESIARLDWTIALARPGRIGGTVTLTIYPGVNKTDPFKPGGNRIGAFSFTAVRITAPGR